MAGILSADSKRYIQSVFRHRDVFKDEDLSALAQKAGCSEAGAKQWLLALRRAVRTFAKSAEDAAKEEEKRRQDQEAKDDSSDSDEWDDSSDYDDEWEDSYDSDELDDSSDYDGWDDAHARKELRRSSILVSQSYHAMWVMDRDGPMGMNLLPVIVSLVRSELTPVPSVQRRLLLILLDMSQHPTTSSQLRSRASALVPPLAGWLGEAARLRQWTLIQLILTMLRLLPPGAARQYPGATALRSQVQRLAAASGHEAIRSDAAALIDAWWGSRSKPDATRNWRLVTVGRTSSDFTAVLQRTTSSAALTSQSQVAKAAAAVPPAGASKNAAPNVAPNVASSAAAPQGTWWGSLAPPRQSSAKQTNGTTTADTNTNSTYRGRRHAAPDIALGLVALGRRGKPSSAPGPESRIPVGARQPVKAEATIMSADDTHRARQRAEAAEAMRRYVEAQQRCKDAAANKGNGSTGQDREEGVPRESKGDGERTGDDAGGRATLNSGADQSRTIQGGMVFTIKSSKAARQQDVTLPAAVEPIQANTDVALVSQERLALQRVASTPVDSRVVALEQVRHTAMEPSPSSVHRESFKRPRDEDDWIPLIVDTSEPEKHEPAQARDTAHALRQSSTGRVPSGLGLDRRDDKKPRSDSSRSKPVVDAGHRRSSVTPTTTTTKGTSDHHAAARPASRPKESKKTETGRGSHSSREPVRPEPKPQEKEREKAIPLVPYRVSVELRTSQAQLVAESRGAQIELVKDRALRSRRNTAVKNDTSMTQNTASSWRVTARWCVFDCAAVSRLGLEYGGDSTEKETRQEDRDKAAREPPRRDPRQPISPASPRRTDDPTPTASAQKLLPFFPVDEAEMEQQLISMLKLGVRVPGYLFPNYE